jgi:hypothetical protein
MPSEIKGPHARLRAFGGSKIRADCASTIPKRLVRNSFMEAWKWSDAGSALL